MGAALLLASRAPLDAVVFGIVVVGSAHLLLEVRFVSGRYRSALSGRVLVAVDAALLAIIVLRLTGPTAWSRPAEILLLMAMLAGVVAVRAPAGPRRVLGLVAVAGATAVALTQTGSWFVAQTWLHNIIPVVFLWDWAAAVTAPRWRWAFRGVTLLWVVAIPVVLLTGAVDGALAGGSAWATSRATAASVTTAFVPTGAGDLAPRLLAAFAFLQVLHYVTWCWHIPRTTPTATAVFETTPVGAQLRGRRFGALVLALTALIVTLAVIDYVAGRNAYTSLASYHAYLEYPVLLLLLLGAARPRADAIAPTLIEARPTASALPRPGDDPA